MSTLQASLTAAALLAVAATASPAYAIDPQCDGTGLDEQGQCVAGTHAAEWCTPDGDYRLLRCKEGEICAEVSDGREALGYTCLDRAATACADIPDEGACPSTEVVVWCSDGRAESKSCEGATECGWDPASQEYDCIVPGRIPVADGTPDAAADTGPEAQPEAQPEPNAPHELVPGGPSPGIGPGSDYLGGGGGDCQGGSPSGPWLAVWLLVALGYLRRR